MSQTLNWDIYLKQKWTVREQKILFTKFICWKDDNQKLFCICVRAHTHTHNTLNERINVFNRCLSWTCEILMNEIMVMCVLHKR